MVGYCCALFLGFLWMGLKFGYGEAQYPGRTGLSEAIMNSMGDMWPENEIKHDCATQHPNMINEWNDYYSKDSTYSSEESHEEWTHSQQYPKEPPTYWKETNEETNVETNDENKSPWNILQQSDENSHEDTISRPVPSHGTSFNEMVPIRHDPPNLNDHFPYDRLLHDHYYPDDSVEVPANVNTKTESENLPQNIETILEKLLRSIGELLAKAVSVNRPLPCNNSDKLGTSSREVKKSEEIIDQSSTTQKKLFLISATTETQPSLSISTANEVPTITRENAVFSTKEVPATVPHTIQFVPEYIKNIKMLTRYAEKQASLLDLIKFKYDKLAKRVNRGSTTPSPRLIDVSTIKTRIDQSTTQPKIQEQLESISSAEPEDSGQESEISSENTSDATEVTIDQSTTEAEAKDLDSTLSAVSDEISSEFSTESNTTRSNPISESAEAILEPIQSSTPKSSPISKFLASVDSILESTESDSTESNPISKVIDFAESILGAREPNTTESNPISEVIASEESILESKKTNTTESNSILEVLASDLSILESKEWNTTESNSISEESILESKKSNTTESNPISQVLASAVSILESSTTESNSISEVLVSKESILEPNTTESNSISEVLASAESTLGSNDSNATDSNNISEVLTSAESILGSTGPNTTESIDSSTTKSNNISEFLVAAEKSIVESNSDSPDGFFRIIPESKESTTESIPISEDFASTESTLRSTDSNATDSNTISEVLTSAESILGSTESNTTESIDSVAAERSILESNSESPEGTTASDNYLPISTSNRRYGPRKLLNQYRPAYSRKKRHAPKVHRPKNITTSKLILESNSESPEGATTSDNYLPIYTSRAILSGPRQLLNLHRPASSRTKRYAPKVHRPKLDSDLSNPTTSTENQSTSTSSFWSSTESADLKTIIDSVLNGRRLNATKGTDADTEILNLDPIVEYIHAGLLAKEKKHHVEPYKKRSRKCYIRTKPRTSKTSTSKPDALSFELSEEIMEYPPLKPAEG